MDLKTPIGTSTNTKTIPPHLLQIHILAMNAFKTTLSLKTITLFFAAFWLLTALLSCSDQVKKSFDDTGRLTSILRYNDENQLEGKSEWFFPSGDRQMEAYYKSGKLYGPQTRYFENGQRQTVT